MVGIPTILAVIGGTVAAYLGTKGILNVDNAVEDSRRGTMKLALWARENGLHLLEDLLENFTVGAKMELVGSIRQVIDTIRDPARSQAALDTFLKTQLAKNLQTEEGKKKVLAIVEETLGVVIDKDALVKAPTTISAVGG